MGMGLKVAYDAVISCGGTITVNSTEGQGTTFVILLPRNGGCDD